MPLYGSARVTSRKQIGNATGSGSDGWRNVNPQFRPDDGGNKTQVQERGANYTVGTDTVSRNIGNSWGESDGGLGPWIPLVDGSDYGANVGLGGFMVHPSASTVRRTWLPETYTQMGEVAVSFSSDKVASGAEQLVYLMARYTNIEGDTDYIAAICRFQVGGAVNVSAVRKNVGGSSIPAGGGSTAVPGLTHAPNAWFRMRFRFTDNGSTTTWNIRLWDETQPEPTTWTMTCSSSGALLASGSIAIKTDNGASTNTPNVTTFRDLYYRPVPATETYEFRPTGGLSFTGSFVKLTGRSLAGGLSFVGAIAKSAARSLAGGLSFSGATAKQPAKALAGGLSFSGSISRRANKALAGGLSFAGSVAKQTNKVLAGGLSFSGILSTLYFGGGTLFTKSLAGGLSFSGSISRRANKALAGGLSFSGSISRRANKVLAGGLSFSGSTAKRTSRSLTGGLSFSGSIAKRAGKVVAGALSFSGAISRRIDKSMSGGLSFVGSVAKRTARSLAGGLSFSGSLGSIRAFTKALTGGLSFSGSISRRTGKSLVGGLTFSSSFGKSIFRSFSSSLSFSGVLSRARIYFRSFSGSLSFSAGLTALRIAFVALRTTDALARPMRAIRRFPSAYRGLRPRR